MSSYCKLTICVFRRKDNAYFDQQMAALSSLYQEHICPQTHTKLRLEIVCIFSSIFYSFCGQMFIILFKWTLHVGEFIILQTPKKSPCAQAVTDLSIGV